MKTLNLFTILSLFCVAQSCVACGCGSWVSFTELFETPNPQARQYQAVIVRNIAVNQNQYSVEVEVLDRLTPGEVDDRIVITDEYGCGGPIERKPGAVWIAAISRDISHLTAPLPVHNIAICAESLLLRMMAASLRTPFCVKIHLNPGRSACSQP
jgi:hypothetical protein